MSTRAFEGTTIPDRRAKPRQAGLTMLIDHWPQDSENQLGWDFADDEPTAIQGMITTNHRTRGS